MEEVTGPEQNEREDVKPSENQEPEVPETPPPHAMEEYEEVDATVEMPSEATNGANYNDVSSNASSPELRDTFSPKYRVEVPNNVTKDGEIIKYTLNVFNVETSSLASSVKRQFEDFEYLDHCITTGNKIDGIIVPSVPPRPPVDPQMAEEASKRVLGASARGMMMGDEFQRSCKQIERYLNQLLAHPVLGRDENLLGFLTQVDAPVRTKVKKGLLARLAGSFDSRSRAGHPDCDEFFQKQRDWLMQYAPVIGDVNDKFEELIAAECRMCTQLTHLCTALSFSLYPNVGANAQHNQFQSKFADALDAVRAGFEVSSYNDEATMGLCLDYYTRSMESLNAMLVRRTNLMVEYEMANKNLDKAKPQRKEQAEVSKREAEKAFEECSDVASLEIKKFHRSRVQEMQDAVARYAEVQAMTSRDTYAVLASAFAKFKELPGSPLAHEKLHPRQDQNAQ